MNLNFEYITSHAQCSPECVTCLTVHHAVGHSGLHVCSRLLDLLTMWPTRRGLRLFAWIRLSSHQGLIWGCWINRQSHVTRSSVLCAWRSICIVKNSWYAIILTWTTCIRSYARFAIRTSFVAKSWYKNETILYIHDNTKYAWSNYRYLFIRTNIINLTCMSILNQCYNWISPWLDCPPSINTTI